MPRELSETDIFVLLANRRRRQLLRILLESTTPLPTVELARRIGDREYEAPSTEDVRAIRTMLYHNHLPRFEGDDVVEWDRIRDTVRPGLNFDAAVRVLETVDEAELAWSDP